MISSFLPPILYLRPSIGGLGGKKEETQPGGSLLSDEGMQWTGNAMMIELPDRAAVETMLMGDPLVKAGLAVRSK